MSQPEKYLHWQLVRAACRFVFNSRMAQVLIFLGSLSLASASAADEHCKPLEPQDAKDLDETFKGEINGKVDGVIGRLVGAEASAEGEYRRIVNDTLKEYPDSAKLYALNRIIYLACVNGGINVERLYELTFELQSNADEPAKAHRLTRTPFPESFWISYVVRFPKAAKSGLWDTGRLKTRDNALGFPATDTTHHTVGVRISIWFKDNTSLLSGADIVLLHEISWTPEESDLYHPKPLPTIFKISKDLFPELASLSGSHWLAFSDNFSASVSSGVVPHKYTWPVFDISLGDLAEARVIAEAWIMDERFSEIYIPVSVSHFSIHFGKGANELVRLKHNDGLERGKTEGRFQSLEELSFKDSHQIGLMVGYTNWLED